MVSDSGGIPMKKSHIRRVQIISMIPEDLLAEFNLLIMNPLTGKPKYGIRNKIIEQAIREYVDARKKQLDN